MKSQSIEYVCLSVGMLADNVQHAIRPIFHVDSS